MPVLTHFYVYYDTVLCLTTCEQTKDTVHYQQNAGNQQNGIDDVTDGDHDTDSDADDREAARG